MVRIFKPPGHPSRELSWEEITDKFNDCARQAKIDAAMALEALDQIRALQTCPDVSLIINKLHH